MNINDSKNELYHYGVLGQKWGVHRYQSKSGGTTSAGRAKYRTNRVIGQIGRAVSYGSFGQRVIGVGLNKGYRQDKKEIKARYKELKKSYDNIADGKERKQRLKTLKNDYKKTKGEARTTAANTLYSWQSKSANEKIQTSHLGKQFVKTTLLQSGTRTYDRLTSRRVNKGISFVAGVASGATDFALAGALKVGLYTVGSISASRKRDE